MKKYKILAISDIHLGAKDCNTKFILNTLKNIKAETILIVGDLFDHHNLHRLKKVHWKVLSKLRKLSKRCKIIYLIGNHCFLKAEFMSILLGFKCLNEYEFSIEDKSFLAMHGDVFDLYFTKYKFFTNLLIKFYYFIRDIHPYAEDLFKKKACSLADKTANIKNNALIYCNQKDKDYIICGHSHNGEIDGKYINTGSFCEDVCSYVVIDKNGKAEIFYDNKKNKQKKLH